MCNDKTWSSLIQNIFLSLSLSPFLSLPLSPSLSNRYTHTRKHKFYYLIHIYSNRVYSLSFTHTPSLSLFHTHSHTHTYTHTHTSTHTFCLLLLLYFTQTQNTHTLMHTDFVFLFLLSLSDFFSLSVKHKTQHKRKLTHKASSIFELAHSHKNSKLTSSNLAHNPNT